MQQLKLQVLNDQLVLHLSLCKRNLSVIGFRDKQVNIFAIIKMNAVQ